MYTPNIKVLWTSKLRHGVWMGFPLCQLGRFRQPHEFQHQSISSRDQQVYRDILAAYQTINLSNAVNLDPIPDPMALGLDPLGEGLGHPLFSTLYRVALCQNHTACQEFFATNFSVVLLKPKAPRQGQVFPLKPLKQRKTGTNETYLQTGLVALVEAVQHVFNATAGARLAQVASLNPLLLEGRDCIKQHQDCLGDTRDACYMDGNEALLSSQPTITPVGPSFRLSKDPNDFLIVVGVLHSYPSVGKATYTNVAVYDVAKAMGVGAVVDVALNGSSTLYDHGRPEFYVWKFARHCDNDTNCYQVPIAPETFPGVPLDQNLTFVERAYLNPETDVGPDPAELLPPVVLHYLPID
eukprot:m.224377 g.224377  ORF g.224377 m.224377 type:complete len:353 (-) comp17033_c2_seq3:2538-3596(-)